MIVELAVGRTSCADATHLDLLDARHRVEEDGGAGDADDAVRVAVVDDLSHGSKWVETR